MEPSRVSPKGTSENLLKKPSDAGRFWLQNPLSSIWRSHGEASSSVDTRGVDNYNSGLEDSREGDDELGADHEVNYHLARERLAGSKRRDPTVSPVAPTARRGPACKETQGPRGKNSFLAPDKNTSSINQKPKPTKNGVPTKKSHNRFQLAKERKASTTLGIIMSAFTVCWLPFFVLAVVRPFLSNEEAIPSSLSSLFLWLGYANSLLNPVIYATLNRDFRRPFQQILYFRCGSLNLMMREEFYQSQYGNPNPPNLHEDEPTCDLMPVSEVKQAGHESFL